MHTRAKLLGDLPVCECAEGIAEPDTSIVIDNTLSC